MTVNFRTDAYIVPEDHGRVTRFWVVSEGCDLRQVTFHPTCRAVVHLPCGGGEAAALIQARELAAAAEKTGVKVTDGKTYIELLACDDFQRAKPLDQHPVLVAERRRNILRKAAGRYVLKV